VPLEKQALKQDCLGSLLLGNQVQVQVSNQGRPNSLLIKKQFELHVVKVDCSTRILDEEEIKVHEVSYVQEDQDQPSVIQEDHDQTNVTQDDHIQSTDLLKGQNQSDVIQEHDDKSTNVVDDDKMKPYEISNDQKLMVLPGEEIELHIINNIHTPRVSLTEEEKEQQMINKDQIDKVTVQNEIEPPAINQELTVKKFSKEGIKEDFDFDQIISVEEKEHYQLHIIDYGVYGEECHEEYV